MPLRNRPPSDPEIVGKSRKAASASPKHGKSGGHAIRLPQVSAPRKPQMLTHGKRQMQHFDPVEMGQKIKVAREEAGFSSQRALAYAIRVSPGLIGQWESHKKSPGIKTLERLARATGKPLSYFVPGVKADEAVLETRFKEEIEIVLLYRQMSPEQKQTHLALFRQSVAVRVLVEP